MAILKGVERGFFDEDALTAEAAQQDARHAEAASHEAIHQAWRQFQDSFADDAPQVVDAIHIAYKTHIQVVSRANLDNAVVMFKRLGFSEKASDLVSAFVEFNKDKISVVDDTGDPFHPTIVDPEFKAALSSVVMPPTPKSSKESLLAIGAGNFRQEDEKSALNLSADDFYNIFKGAGRDELGRIVEGSLFWRRVINATEPQREMTERALAALERIGRESPINASRVKKYGINVEADDSITKD